MSEFVFAPAATPSVAVADSSQRFPVHCIYCVSQNYATPGREISSEPPVFFMKPADTIVANGAAVPYPPSTTNCQHEIELVVAIGRGGRDISERQALEHVFGYAVGIDMTRRDLQAEAKKLQRPWEVGKAFEHSAPSTALLPAQHVENPARGAIWLDVNGVRKQTGDLSHMIWDIPHQIAFLSTLFELQAGDLIFTGTPSGVGAVHKGDRLKGHVEGIGELDVTII